ncbi:MAG: Smr/MutS family protein [Gemmatimonadota bacterium]
MDHALEVLNFQRVLEAVARRAGSAPGKERILALRPSAHRPSVEAELARVAAAGDFLTSRPQWSPPPCPDARRGLRRLQAAGALLDGEDLLQAGGLLQSARLLREALDQGVDVPLIRELLQDPLLVVPALERELLGALEDDGSFRDGASPELTRIRRRLRGLHGALVKELNRFVASLPERWVVPDASVSIRDGRYVVPLRREARGEVGGVVHGESATGATLFVEPPVALQRMAELSELERSEEREIQRLLAHFTQLLSGLQDELSASQEAQIRFDTLQARARMAREWDGHSPGFLPEGPSPLRIVAGRHPLLVLQDEEVVPFNLELDHQERAMVVSGPNTGGKTVLLTAVGLISALAQAGVVPPVGPGTRLPIFRDFFVDMGDEQSIQRSLSTFSAHLMNARAILDGAGPGSLVLLDEAGTGTDPAEGAALARALVEELVARGSRVILTSHLGALKRMDEDGSGVVNASFQFDSQRIRPTYELVKGRPGRSYGLLMAQRLGLPPDLLRRAREVLGETEVQVEELLSRLETRERELQGVESRARRDQEEVARLREELETRQAAIRQREKELEKLGRTEARKYLLEARARVEEVIQGIQSEAGESVSLGPETIREARRAVEDEASRQHQATPGSTTPASPGGSRSGGSLALRPGARVRFGAEGTLGRVAELRDGRVAVEVGGLRLHLPESDVEVVPPAGASSSQAGGSPGKPAVEGWEGPQTDASPEVDFRGLRVEELEMELPRALDGAVMGGLHLLTIIHGKGTGALRGRVAELLREDPRVAEARSGAPAEGGTGVTVVTFR